MSYSVLAIVHLIALAILALIAILWRRSNKKANASSKKARAYDMALVTAKIANGLAIDLAPLNKGMYLQITPNCADDPSNTPQIILWITHDRDGVAGVFGSITVVELNKAKFILERRSSKNSIEIIGLDPNDPTQFVERVVDMIKGSNELREDIEEGEKAAQKGPG